MTARVTAHNDLLYVTLRSLTVAPDLPVPLSERFRTSGASELSDFFFLATLGCD